jgi:hypothetical protein
VYIFKGGPHRPRSQWLGDGVADHTMIVVVPTEWRGTGMHANHYVRVGMSTSEYFAHDELEIVESDDTVTWRLGDMEYASQLDAGIHVVRGEHAEVGYDLRFEQLPGTTTVPLFGELEDAATTRAAGAYSYSNCRGTLTIGDRVFPIEDAQGLHEHIAFSECPNWDVAAIGPLRDQRGGGVYGSFRTADGLVGQIHSETPEETTVVIATGTEDVVFTGASVTLTRTDEWIDPKNGVAVPCRWTVECASDDGALSLAIDGYARGGWAWELKRSLLWQTVVLATVEGSFTDRTGTVRAIPQTVGVMDNHRMLHVHRETLDGPDTSPTW